MIPGSSPQLPQLMSNGVTSSHPTESGLNCMSMSKIGVAIALDHQALGSL